MLAGDICAHMSVGKGRACVWARVQIVGFPTQAPLSGGGSSWQGAKTTQSHLYRAKVQPALKGLRWRLSNCCAPRLRLRSCVFIAERLFFGELRLERGFVGVVHVMNLRNAADAA